MTRAMCSGCWPSMFAVLLALRLALVTAGPVGPLPNVTSSDLGLKEGNCALGDVVYLEGDEFPGASTCERCRCTRGEVQCATQQCQPRPGCKALHRPDHCCPTYQCECEQDGHVYGNGEKLVDPQDPCRVCYCQGGEVVCRRIACFVRDDCLPRRTPGRCCPEYDNCPLRGVSTISGVSQKMSTSIETETSPAPAAPKEKVKQEITIKEITPVSEIPAVNDIKVKEVLPADIEVPEYPSSKSPLIVREATSEKDEIVKTEAPAVEVKLSSSSSAPLLSEDTRSVTILETTNIVDSLPSKIILSTQGSIKSEIFPSVIITAGSATNTPKLVPMASSKAPVIEEDDTMLFEHNPAFPPLPDDLSVLSNHEDELVSEPSLETERAPITEARTTNPPPTTIRPITTTAMEFLTTPLATTTIKAVIKTPNLTTSENKITNHLKTLTTQSPIFKESPMLNLRSAIPTEILNLPSFVPEEITGVFDEFTTEETNKDSYDSTVHTYQPDTTKIGAITTKNPEVPADVDSSPMAATVVDLTTKAPETAGFVSNSIVSEETTSSIAKYNIATEIAAQTELSSLPIETSDQNPRESEHIYQEKVITTTEEPITQTVTIQSAAESVTMKVSSAIEPEITTSAKQALSTTKNLPFENVETTEFVLTPLGSLESATDSVELIRISAESEKSAAIIESLPPKKNSVLTDLINLVGDVAELGAHTDGPDGIRTTVTAGYSDSEELIPVNAGYKSKNSNWNLNSITEMPGKTKTPAPTTDTRQKVVEIEGEDTDSITDAAPPHDRVEPTTQRPIIDHVSDDQPALASPNGTDFEIITRSYVPTINRRPTKMVMKKNNDKPHADEEQATTEDILVSSSEALSTESDSDEAGSGEPSSTTTQ